MGKYLTKSELGLIGSQDMAKKYRAADINVIAMVQFDMNLYSDTNKDEIYLVTNNTDSTLTSDLASYSTNYVGMTPTRARLRGGSSDHAAWSRQGFAAAFPFEKPSRSNPNIHSSNDTIANSGRFSMASAFAKMGLAYLGHYAGLISM